MKIIKSLLAFSLLFFSLISLAATTPATLSPTQQTDAQILKAIIQINTNEIKVSKLAEKRTNNTAVKQFAQMMVTDHSKNRQDAKALATKITITPMTSAKSDTLKQNGVAELKTLKSTKQSDFDKTYMDAMVKGHQAVLAAIDNDLLPKANNADLKNFLTATRAAVAHHLEEAQKVQKTL